MVAGEEGLQLKGAQERAVALGLVSQEDAQKKVRNCRRAATPRHAVSSMGM